MFDELDKKINNKNEDSKNLSPKNNQEIDNINKETIKMAQEILKIDNKTAKWIATDALRELTSQAVQKRLSC